MTAAGLAAAARRRGAAVLAGEAQRVDQPFDWDDLVLPDDRVQRLHALGDRLRHRALVHDQWGFAAKLGAARGVAALFTGPSGTGKTMAAGVLAARARARPLPRSTSPASSASTSARPRRTWPGSSPRPRRPTRPVLRRGRRPVRQADRGARRARPLRQHRGRPTCCSGSRSYDGVVVLATNLREQRRRGVPAAAAVRRRVPASRRRAHRLRIWRQIWPAAAPLDPDARPRPARRPLRAHRRQHPQRRRRGRLRRGRRRVPDRPGADLAGAAARAPEARPAARRGRLARSGERSAIFQRSCPSGKECADEHATAAGTSGPARTDRGTGRRPGAARRGAGPDGDGVRRRLLRRPGARGRPGGGPRRGGLHPRKRDQLPARYLGFRVP